MSRFAHARTAVVSLLMPAAACLATGCFAPRVGTVASEGPIGTAYSFPRTDLAVVRPDAVVFYSLNDEEFDDLPAAERDGLKAVLPEFYAHIIAVEATLRRRGILVDRTAAPVLRFQDTDGTIQVYERRLHPGGTGMVLFKHGKPIDPHPGVASEQEILAAVERYFSDQAPIADPPGETHD